MPILEILYFLCAALLAVYGLNTFFHTWTYWRLGRDAPDKRTPEHTEWIFGDCGTRLPEHDNSGEPHVVTVQLPIYNERHVAPRLLAAVANLDWPVDRLQIQILDDSSDDTSQIIEAALAPYSEKGIEIEHVRRPDRRGFKAGALQHGLATARGALIAIFDADFVPPPDFLRKTVPTFTDPGVGCVQTRWGHVNPDTSHLTTAQALGIDGHFVVEQHARHTLGAYLNFNGTAGIWRRCCMEDAGGWQGDTLTEDLDLSYRAQLRGWRIAFLPDVVVPAELPVQIDAFKRQQFRWAKGSIQTAVKLLGRLWQTPQPFWRKGLGTLHLTNYAVHPLMLINLLLLLPMTVSHSPLLALTPVFVFSAFGPPLMYWAAMQSNAVPWHTRLQRLALLLALGTGLSINNTRAVVEAVTGIAGEFKRTPKFAVIGRSSDWQASTYVLPREPTAWVELILALYALGLLVYSLVQGLWWLVFWPILYAGGYGYIASLAFLQAWKTRSTRAPRSTSCDGRVY